MIYNVTFSDEAERDVKKMKRNEPLSYKKLLRLLLELQTHPKTGTGQIEKLKHCKEETWSRRISSKHRLVYRIYDDIVEVLILSAWGHYDEK